MSMSTSAHVSLVRSLHLSPEHAPTGDLHSDASRNSSESSAGSHKSQDSGFSDSGETRRRQQQLSQLQASLLPVQDTSSCVREHRSHTCHNQQQRNLNRQNATFCSTTFKDSQIVQQGFGPKHHSYHYELYHSRCEHSTNHYYDLHLSLPVPPLPTSQVPVSVVVNGTPACLPLERQDFVENNADCANGNCSCQEIIVSRPTHQAMIDQLPSSDQNGVFGAPTFCSTPKKSFSSPSFTPSKMTVMQKIDNFESLNKNVNVAKALDNNNNNNNNNNSPEGISFASGSETRSSFFSRPPSRIPTPPPITPPRAKSVTRHDASTGSHVSGGDETLSYPTILSTHGNNGKNDEKPCTFNISQYSHDNEELEESLFSFCRISPKIKDVSNNYRSSQLKQPSTTTTGSKCQSLPKGFKRMYVGDEPNTELIVKSHFDNDAVRLWLHELREHTEPEVFHTLQLKELNNWARISSESWFSGINNSYGSPHQLLQVANNYNDNLPSSASVHLVSASILSIRYVERISNIVSAEFSRICRYLEFKMHAQVPSIIFTLLEHIENFLSQLKISNGSHTKSQSRLATTSENLRMSTVTFCEDIKKQSRPSDTLSNRENGESPYMRPMVDSIVSIGNQFSQVVDQILTKNLSTLLDVIENGGFGARVALESLPIVLYDGGMQLCRLAAHLRTVRGLLSCIIETKDENEQILALRSLATILCVGEAVKDFDNAGGFEIVADILHDSGFGMTVKYEAIAVFTQVTDPWIDLETILRNLGPHLDKIVVALTNLVELYAKDADSFLLLVAAISNLTFLESSSIDLLKQYGTVQLIINAVQQKTDYFSVFIMDHVSTILANIAGVERCRSDIVKAGGIPTLLYFLKKSPSPFDSIPEITACERLQQKSTIAISRLTNENGVPEVVLKMGGIERLVQLSKDEKERNYSDGVLIACLATLRKLVTVCGSDLIQQLQAEDLIYPRLLDSFLLFSSRQESCV